MDQQLIDLIEATRDQAAKEGRRIQLEEERIALEKQRSAIEQEKLKKLDLILEKTLRIETLIQSGIDPEVRRMSHWVNLLLEIQRILASKLISDSGDTETGRMYELLRDLKNQDINLNFQDVKTVVGQVR